MQLVFESLVSQLKHPLSHGQISWASLSTVKLRLSEGRRRELAEYRYLTCDSYGSVMNRVSGHHQQGVSLSCFKCYRALSVTLSEVPRGVHYEIGTHPELYAVDGLGAEDMSPRAPETHPSASRDSSPQPA